MLADPDGVLDRATNPDGTRRFYPPYAHPATRRLRERLFLYERLREGGTENAISLDQAIEDYREELARFERGEDIDKARYLVAAYERATYDRIELVAAATERR